MSSYCGYASFPTKTPRLGKTGGFSTATPLRTPLTSELTELITHTNRCIHLPRELLSLVVLLAKHFHCPELGR